MKVIKINNKDYVLKFTSKVISELHMRDITITSLSEEIKNLKTNNLYIAFYFGLSSMQKITIDEAYELIDQYFEEDENREMEDFFMLVIDEYSKAMGLGKSFKVMKKELEQKELEQEAIQK